MTVENFATRVKQSNLANKSHIANLVNEIHFDNKLLSFIKRINSNKTKHVLVENKLSELSKKVEAVSTKGLTKYLINGCKILNEERYFFQEYYKIIKYIFHIKNILDFSLTDLKFYHGNL